MQETCLGFAETLEGVFSVHVANIPATALVKWNPTQDVRLVLYQKQKCGFPRLRIKDAPNQKTPFYDSSQGLVILVLSFDVFAKIIFPIGFVRIIHFPWLT